MTEIDRYANTTAPATENILQTHDLTTGYRARGKLDVVVSHGLNLSIRRGELVCLLGPNGAGKSTLMRTIAGMQPPLAGHVTLNGENIAGMQPHALASRLSVVLTERPNVGLLNGYALVALGRHPHTDWTGRLTRYDEAVVHWAVEAVGAVDIADRPVMELSDGQRQKLMIARALAQESEVILLDEPTAYLDMPRRAEVMHLLGQLAKNTGRAILLSTHDLDLALRTADTLWLMSGGAVRAGVAEDLVLSGEFEAAFSGEGVTFDRETGAFTIERESKQQVTVIGQGVAYTWTHRAVRRAGFSVTDAPECAVRVEIQEDDSGTIWHLWHNQTQSTHNSIRSLLAALEHLAD